MALQTPSTLEANNGHGIRPFGYRVEFASAPAGQTFPNLLNARWSQRLVKLLSLTKAYGSHDQFAQLSTWDPEAVFTDSLDFPSQWLKEQALGTASAGGFVLPWQCRPNAGSLPGVWARQSIVAQPVRELKDAAVSQAVKRPGLPMVAQPNPNVTLLLLTEIDEKMSV